MDLPTPNFDMIFNPPFSFFSAEEMNKMISSLEGEKNLDDLKNVGNIGVNKRLTVDFMGMQVSYPQYLRLVKLQEKVVKLNQVRHNSIM